MTLEQALGRNQTISATPIGAFGRNLLPAADASVSAELHHHPLCDQRRDLELSGRAVTVPAPPVARTPEHRVLRVVSREDVASEDVSFSGPRRGRRISTCRTGLAPRSVMRCPSSRSDGPRPDGSGRRSPAAGRSRPLVQVQSGYPFTPIAGSVIQPGTGLALAIRPNPVPGQPQWIDDPSAPGGRRVNIAAFVAPPAGQQGTVGRNSLRGFPIRQVDLTLNSADRAARRGPAPVAGSRPTSVFNWPNFGPPNAQLTAAPAIAGRSSSMFGTAIGGLTSLYQTGGPRAAAARGQDSLLIF